MVSMSFWTHFTAGAILPENFSSDPTYGHDEARQENRCGCGECQFSRIAEGRRGDRNSAEERQDHALTRKLFNVLLAVAQQADDSGDTYRALLSDIVANSAFDSNDTALVKEHLRRMVSVQVEWSTGTSSQKPGRKWGSRR